MSYPEYLAITERKILDAVIKSALTLGYAISVYDGEEWSLKKSVNYDAITAEIAASDETTIKLRRADGSAVGNIYFIHGNDVDVLADYSDNPATEEIARAGMDVADRL